MLTAEDFRYALEDVLLNKELNHGVIPEYLLVEGKGPKFEIIDDLMPQSPLYRDECASAYAAHDPKAANALLDEMGLSKRDLRSTQTKFSQSG